MTPSGKIGGEGTSDDSALKGPESAREAAQDVGGGGGAQVFEVTDLVIPAGTSWMLPIDGGTWHEFARAPLPSGVSIRSYLYLELAETPPSITQVRLGLYGEPDHGFINEAPIVPDGNDAVWAESLYDGSLIVVGSPWTVGPTFPTEITGRLAAFTPGQPNNGLITDITVVRARAAFLVI